MVSINPNFGPNNLGASGKAKQVTNEPPKPTTDVKPLVIYRHTIDEDGNSYWEKVYDDGKKDYIYFEDEWGTLVSYKRNGEQNPHWTS